MRGISAAASSARIRSRIRNPQPHPRSASASASGAAAVIRIRDPLPDPHRHPRSACASPRYFLLLPLLLALAFAPARAAEGPSDFSKTLDGLLPGLASSSPGDLARADQSLERLCHSAARPGAEAERRALAAALAAKLGSDLSPRVKELFVRQLQVIGKEESVAPLAALLTETTPEHLRDAARRALEANPAPQSVRAIRKAYAAASGSFRAALIQSLGMRKDTLCVGELMEDAASEDRTVRMAAFDALSRIGDRSAVEVFESSLEKGGPDSREIRTVYLRLADSMIDSEERGAARRIFLQALRYGPIERLAGLEGLGRAGLPVDAPVLLEALSDPDPKARGAARDALAVMRAATKPLADRLVEAKQPGRAALRRDIAIVLGRRGDPAAAAALIAALKDVDTAVRAAAVEAIGKTGGEGAAQAVLAALSSDEEAIRRAAARALQSLAGVEKAAVGALAEAKPESRAALVGIFGRRSGGDADAILKRGLADPDERVRAAAYRALTARGDAETPARLLEALDKETGAAREAALASLAGYRDEETTKKLLASLAGASGTARIALIDALGGRPQALDALLGASREADAAVRVAALRALSRSEADAVLPVLTEAAAVSEPAVRSAAREGLLQASERLARGNKEARSKAAEIYRLVLASDAAEAQKRAALRGLGEVGEVSDIDGIRSLLSPGPLRRDAGRTALKLAFWIPSEEKTKAIEVYNAILAADPDQRTARECARELEKFGVK